MIPLLLGGCTGAEEEMPPDSDPGDTGDSPTDGDSADSPGPNACWDEGADTSVPCADDVATAKIVGEEREDWLGYTDLSPPGDMNGDGRADLVLSAVTSSRYAYHSGAVYFFETAPSGWTDAGSASGFLEVSEVSTVRHGAAGDLDGDGNDDLIVTAGYASTDSAIQNRVYFLYGPISGTVSLESADDYVEGAPSESDDWRTPVTGRGPAGDTNGDGYDDVLIDARRPDLGGLEAFLLPGPVLGFHVGDEGASFRYTDSGAGELRTLTGAGDVDGDGMDDIVIGRLTSEADRVLLFRGPLAGDHTVADADASFQDDIDYGAGYDPAIGAGDMNHDGYDDLAVGSGFETEDGTDVDYGVYLEYGPFEGAISLPDAPAALLTEGTVFGSAIAAGDFDADGETDVVVSEAGYGDTYRGRACVLFGPFAGTTDIVEQGSCWQGDGEDLFGYTVANAGDLDEDGHDDILLGGPYDADNGYEAGAVWLFSGAGIERRD